MSKHRLGDLQLAIMRVLWARSEATAGEVHQELLETRGLALTTIATMLRKMEDKGVVAHRKDSRHFVYRACVLEDEVHRTMVGELVDRLFDGDPAALVSHLVEEGEIDVRELESLRARLRRRPRRRRKGGRNA